MSATATAHRRASEFEPLVLLQVVRHVGETSLVDAPQLISTRLWDAARGLDERFGDAPAARRICEHLRLPWEKVRELAFMSGHSQRVALGQALRNEEVDWLTEEYSNFALQLIARRLGTRTLPPCQYRAERQLMVRSRPRQLLLPTAEQIEIITGSWDDAVARAGLAPRHGLGGQRARVGPVPIVEVLNRCYEHHRTEPTLGELVLFARANGIPFPRKGRRRPYSAYVKEWKDARSAGGLPVPDGPPPKFERPDYSRDVGAAVSGERRATTSWSDHDEVVEWVTRYLRELKPGERSSQRAYDTWAPGEDGAPWASVLQRHGGWVAVRNEAWKRLTQ